MKHLFLALLPVMLLSMVAEAQEVVPVTVQGQVTVHNKDDHRPPEAQIWFREEEHHASQWTLHHQCRDNSLSALYHWSGGEGVGYHRDRTGKDGI